MRRAAAIGFIGLAVGLQGAARPPATLAQAQQAFREAKQLVERGNGTCALANDRIEALEVMVKSNYQLVRDPRLTKDRDAFYASFSAKCAAKPSAQTAQSTPAASNPQTVQSSQPPPPARAVARQAVQGAVPATVQQQREDGAIPRVVTFAGLAANAANIDAAHFHLHHVLNCLVGPGGNGFDAAVGNPCIGTGAAIPQTADTATRVKLENAAIEVRRGISSNDLSAARNVGAGVLAVLTGRPPQLVQSALQRVPKQQPASPQPSAAATQSGSPPEPPVRAIAAQNARDAVTGPTTPQIVDAIRKLNLELELRLCELGKLMGRCDDEKAKQIAKDDANMEIIVNDTTRQADGSYISIVTTRWQGESRTSKFGFLRGADGLVITCYASNDGRHDCR